MKQAIACFIKHHPFLTAFIVSEVVSGVRNTVVGVSQAITGNYPPEDPCPVTTTESEVEAEEQVLDEPTSADSTESD